MAYRTWGRMLLTALGVSLLAGAGQLGIAYGLGVLRFARSFEGAPVNQWPAQLTWVSWFAASAAVIGAVGALHLTRRERAEFGVPARVAVAAASALGAAGVAPLCMQPARAAQLMSVEPVPAVGLCAVIGAVVGLFAALAVLTRPPFGWNVALFSGALWLLALLSVAPFLGPTDAAPAVRLGVFGSDQASRLVWLTLPVLAFLAGIGSGVLARRRGHPPLVVGASGALGPSLLALAYLAAGPGDTTDRYQSIPYQAALAAVLAGVLGSAAAAGWRWPLVTAATFGRIGRRSTAIEPTDILLPLPSGPPEHAAAAGDRPGGSARHATAADQPVALTLPVISDGESSVARPEGPDPTEPARGGTPTPTEVGPAADTATRPATGDGDGDGDGDGELFHGRAGHRPATAANNALTWPTGRNAAIVAATPPPVPDPTVVQPDPTLVQPGPAVAERDAGRNPATDPTVVPGPTAATIGDADASPAPESGPVPPAQRRPADPPHRPDLPDLSEVPSWDAFGTNRRPARRRSATTSSPSPAAQQNPTSAPTLDADTDTRTTSSPRTDTGAGLRTDTGAGAGATAVTGRRSAAPSDPPAVDGEPTEQATAAPGPEPVTDAEPPGDAGDGAARRGLRGLFRRGRPRDGQVVDEAGAGSTEAEEEPARERPDEPLPAQDEEYLNWVSGLGDPAADRSAQTGAPRSLRPTGRHHAD